jgi:membrane protease YdiL (CAAX protease family)
MAWVCSAPSASCPERPGRERRPWCGVGCLAPAPVPARSGHPAGQPLPAWVLLTVAASVIYTWMYNGTGGSLLIVVLFHAASNLPLTILLEPLEDQVHQPFLIYVALMILAAAVVVAATGPANLPHAL